MGFMTVMEWSRRSVYVCSKSALQIWRSKFGFVAQRQSRGRCGRCCNQLHPVSAHNDPPSMKAPPGDCKYLHDSHCMQTCSNQSYPTLYTVVSCISIYLLSTTPRVNRGKPRFTIVPGWAPLRWEGSAPSPVSLPGCWLKEWSQLSVPPESDTWTVWAMGLSWLDPNGIWSFKFHPISSNVYDFLCWSHGQQALGDLTRSALLGPSFSPANCLAKLAAAQQRPSPSKVLSADLQDGTAVTTALVDIARKPQDLRFPIEFRGWGVKPQKKI